MADSPIWITEEEAEFARQKIEDLLISLRDNRISLPLRNNGLVCKEKDGNPSSMIRIGFEQALLIAIEHINDKRREALRGGG